MTSKVSDLIGYLETDIVARVSGVTFATGKRFLPANARSTPSIVWVPLSNSFGPPRTVGARPRQFYTNFATIAAHCWAADFAGAELLLEAVAAAAHRVAHGSVAIGDADWSMPDFLTRGESVTLGVTFATAVTDDAHQTVIVLSETPTTPIVSGDGILERGEV